ncbi:MAG: bifunctional metallophosphatase/5'-nucleotidase [Bacteroidales bacterium]|nr:bifunctional metallophosphatase/5'-nucleotidase [Bacteroidales bacterium]
MKTTGTSKPLVLFLVMLGCLTIYSCVKQPTSFIVLQTSDLHGRFDSSLAGLAGYVHHMKEEYKDRALLLDAGDYLQGTPGLYYSSHIDTVEKHICAAFFDWFPYTAISVGNHDIEAGMSVFSRVFRQMEVPILSANVIHESTRKPYFEPYKVFSVKGYKIAVIGMLTPHVSSWVAERLRPGLDFLSIEESAAYWIPHIREKEKPDLLIGLFHTGAKGGATGELGSENASLWVAEHVPGIDLICYGHDHRPAIYSVLGRNRDTVWLMNPGAGGEFLAQAKVLVSPRGRNRVQIVPELIKTDTLEPGQEYLNAFTPYFQRAYEYERKPIAELLNTIESRRAFEGPSAWVDEVHRGQLTIAGLHTDLLPDVSFASALSDNAVLRKGQLYLKDFFTWFPYENSLCILEMTGSEIKQYLEYSYSQTDIINFDTAAGIFYTVFKDKPEGERIQIHALAGGFDFVQERKYKVVMNSYRAQGGGGHLLEGVGWDAATIRARMLWESKTDMRQDFMNWEASRSPFRARPLPYWRYQ